MTKTSAPTVTPKPSRVGTKPAPKNTESPPGPGMVTLGLATNMAWQLAIVVLVPVVGGALLDSHFDTEPVLTIIGLVIALVGMILVVRNTVKQLNGYMAVTNKETSDDN